MKSLSKRVAVVGVGDVNYPELYKTRYLPHPRDPYSLGIEALKNALDDCGLKKDDLDGVICVRDIKQYDQFCYRLGVDKLRLVNGLESTGRQSGLAVQYAAMAIQSGMASTVAVVYANNGRTARFNYGSTGDGGDPFGIVHGMTSPGAQVAAMYSRYCYEFGISDDATAKIAISQRYHASLNPNAVFKEPLNMQKYKEARYITEPFRLFDYCMINDGAVALILTSVERAKDLKKPVVEILSSEACGDMKAMYMKEDFFYNALQRISSALYSKAGVTIHDIDNFQLYDNFTSTVLFTMEGIGLCERGGAENYIDTHGITLGKCTKPVNTSGGHTSEAYMQGFNHHVECIRQLRHECGARQVKDSKLSMYVCAAPILSGHIFARL